MLASLLTPSASSATVRIAVYRALLRGASRLERELCRCEALRAREVAQLLRVTPADGDTVDTPNPSAAPAERRSSASRSSPGSMSKAATSAVHSKPRTAATMAVAASPVASVRAAARTQPYAIDYAFAAMRHINTRVAALERMVYHNASEAVTADVRVRVQSEFIRYEPTARRYFFAYNVTMTNESRSTMQLLSRKWVITDLNGSETEVEGPGVVGTFPILRPGQKYEYSSGTPLKTPLGTQTGHFLFVAHQHFEDPESSFDPTQSEETVSQLPASSSAAPAAQALVIKVAPFSLRNDNDPSWPPLPDKSLGPDQPRSPHKSDPGIDSDGPSKSSGGDSGAAGETDSDTAKMQGYSSRGRRLRRPRRKR